MPSLAGNPKAPSGRCIGLGSVTEPTMWVPPTEASEVGVLAEEVTDEAPEL